MSAHPSLGAATVATKIGIWVIAPTTEEGIETTVITNLYMWTITLRRRSIVWKSKVCLKM
jgi:hypothetical protein